jgi:hypothetical protein
MDIRSWAWKKWLVTTTATAAAGVGTWACTTETYSCAAIVPAQDAAADVADAGGPGVDAADASPVTNDASFAGDAAAGDASDGAAVDGDSPGDAGASPG